MGRMVSARTRFRPGNSTRASTQARGRPSTKDSPVAHSEQTRERRSASVATGELRSDNKEPHGAFVSSPTRGRARKPTVTVATMSTTAARPSSP